LVTDSLINGLYINFFVSFRSIPFGLLSSIDMDDLTKNTPNNSARTKKRSSALIILDGWGHREDAPDNAISVAKIPTLDRFWQEQPHTLIEASSSFVGLPNGQMGNSEVGHMNIGAGRIVYQDLTRIDQAIKEGDFNNNLILVQALNDVANQEKAVHIMGLTSLGGVHSHERHILAMIDLAYQKGAKTIYVHAFLDGRDTPPKSAQDSLQLIDQRLKETGKGYIASIIGRYYAMDRDQRWERTELAYGLIVQGKSVYQAIDAVSGLKAAYQRGENDEFVNATAIVPEGSQPVSVKKGDAVIFMNFRADRARQLSYAFANKPFHGFERSCHPALSHFVTLTQYASDIDAACAFPPLALQDSLGEVIASSGKTQLRLAETEKYAHVTFFFNGGREEPFVGEERCMVPSPNVATYDLQPEMSAEDVTDHFVKAIESGKYDLIVCNYANGDMVGHTGNFDAAVKAVEAVDTSIGRVVEALTKMGGQCLITADHGNAEQMMDHETKQAHTAHTCEPVPLIYAGPQQFNFKAGGRLCDLAPTLLKLMSITKPEAMTGNSLIDD